MLRGDLNTVRHEGHVIGKQYWGDLSGEELHPSMVMAARSEELKEFIKQRLQQRAIKQMLGVNREGTDRGQMGRCQQRR